MRSNRIIIVLIWLAVITFLSLMPGKDIPHSGLFGIPHLDKAVHAGLYAILAFLLVWSLHAKKRSKFITALLFCVVYGGLMEILQVTIAVNRLASWGDWLADLVGALLGLFLFPYLRAYCFKKRYFCRE